ncbi:MAG: transcription antitermination factor NusB [candidate division Zixibacteria bacterium]|nr:transcription antitermination factor NusB [candidate division Zixibacteria bacterium]
MSRRRQGRELALGCLYAHFSTGEPVETVFQGQASRMSCDAETESYAKRLFLTAVTEGEAIDRAIRERSENWDFSRIGNVEKNLLRLSIAELWFFPETPGKVIINEAVELARDYVGEESCAFINALLDRVYKQGTGRVSPNPGAALPEQQE